MISLCNAFRGSRHATSSPAALPAKPIAVRGVLEPVYDALVALYAAADQAQPFGHGGATATVAPFDRKHGAAAAGASGQRDNVFIIGLEIVGHGVNLPSSRTFTRIIGCVASAGKDRTLAPLGYCGRAVCLRRHLLRTHLPRRVSRPFRLIPYSS
jgi:hypothetical protein